MDSCQFKKRNALRERKREKTIISFDISFEKRERTNPQIYEKDKEGNNNGFHKMGNKNLS